MKQYTQLRRIDDDLSKAVAPINREPEEDGSYREPQGFPFVEKPYPGSGKVYRHSTNEFEDEVIPEVVPQETLTIAPGTLQTDTGRMLERLLKGINVVVEIS